VFPTSIPEGGHVSSEIHENKEKKAKPSATGIILEGFDDILVRFAKCCSPVPGDDIIGYITRGRGVTVHRADCTNFEKTEDATSRFIEVSWDNRGKQTAYSSEIQIIAPDRKGLLGEITVLISEFNLIVTGVNAKLTKNNMAIIHLTVEINDTEQLVKLIKKIQAMPEIIEVKRVTS
jgi:GTP pyrophosphokinase